MFSRIHDLFHAIKLRLRRGNVSQAGFTLIELSVAITIVSFLVVNTIVATESQEEVKDQRKTHQHLEMLKKTIDNFVRAYGYYPCPADGSQPIADPQFGLDSRNNTSTSTGAAQNIKCLANFTETGGDLATIGGLVVPRNNRLVVGTVPTRALGLPPEAANDEWGRRIMYAITEDLTRPASYYHARNGRITVYQNAMTDGKSADTNFAGPIGSLALAESSSSSGIGSDSVAYVLLSYGPNGVGAFAYDAWSSGGNVAPRTRPQTPENKKIVDNFFEFQNHHRYDAFNIDDTLAAGNSSNLSDASVIADLDAKFTETVDMFDDTTFIQSKRRDANASNRQDFFDDVLVYSYKVDLTEFNADDPDHADQEFVNEPFLDYVPDSIPGLVLWYAANKSSGSSSNGITEVSGKGTAWADTYVISSGGTNLTGMNNVVNNSLVVGTSSGPVMASYTSAGSVTHSIPSFSGTEFFRDAANSGTWFMPSSSPGTLPSSRFSIFTVFTTDVINDSRSLFQLHDYSAYQDKTDSVTVSRNSAELKFDMWSSTGATGSSGGSFSSGSLVSSTPYIISIIDGYNTSLTNHIDAHINGECIGGCGMTADLSVFNTLCLGGSFNRTAPSCSASWDGGIMEFIVYDHRVSDVNKFKIEKYLAEKYNITDYDEIYPTSSDTCSGLSTVGTACTAHSQCCSGFCSNSFCRIKTLSQGNGDWRVDNVREKCTRNVDCAGSSGVCNLYGWCWVPDACSSSSSSTGAGNC